MIIVYTVFSSSYRVKLAVHKETKECVAVKIIQLEGENGLTLDCLKKEVISTLHALLWAWLMILLT